MILWQQELLKHMRSTTGTQTVSQAVQENLPLAFFKAKMGNSGLESKWCPNSQLPPPVHGLQRVWSCHGCAWLCTSGGGRAGALPHMCGGWLVGWGSCFSPVGLSAGWAEPCACAALPDFSPLGMHQNLHTPPWDQWAHKRELLALWFNCWGTLIKTSSLFSTILCFITNS